MDVELNWIAIVLATVVALIVGSVWYSNLAFGKTWSRLSGVDQEQMKQAGIWPMVVALAASLLISVGLAHFSYLSYKFLGLSFLNSSLQTAILAWVSFSFTTLVMHNSFEGKRKKLTLVNTGFGLVLFLSIGLVLGLVGI